jgi:hypothetical protein
MTQILMIAPIGSTTVARRHQQDLALSLHGLGHEISVLAPHTPTRLRARRAGVHERPPATLPTLELRIPPLGCALPAAFDAALRRMLPAALRRSALSRPDAMVVSAVDTSVVVARVLSVLYGVPYVLMLDDSVLAPARRSDRFEQLLAHSVQDATAVAATSPELAEQLRRRFSLSTVQVRPAESADALAESVSSMCIRAMSTAQGRRMVFHAPYPLDPAPTSASRQRPNKMLAAFSEEGFQVHRVTGDPFQRALGVRDLRRRVAGGQAIDFVYSENSTQPNVLATSLKRGVAPLLEARLIGFCERRAIPFGQFYRDVYWRFPEKQSAVPGPRRLAMRIAYRTDLAVLRRSHAQLFVPSLPMARIIPFDERRCTALPPGAQVRQSPSPPGLQLLYVGGVGPGHEIDEALRALREVEQAHLTMVVPRPAWESHRERYAPLLTDRVRVIHAGSEELSELYDGASAGLLLVEPNEYRRFAVPMKMYEYLGQGKPTLASRGTLAGALVDEMGIGFTATNAQDEISALLERLLEDSAMLDDVRERVRSLRHEHTWAMRARTVAEVLTGRCGA